MPLSAQKLAGPGYIILNVLRIMNIISLLSVIAGSMVMLVKTIIVSKFFFFDAATNLITSLVSMFLIVSELSLFAGYFARNWPILSPTHGFVSLGLAMMILGINMLGNLNKEATSQASLGLAFWRIVIASGILVFVLGIFNIIASFVFRNKNTGITARNVRAHGAIATPTPVTNQKQLSINTSLPPPVTMSPSLYSSYKEPSNHDNDTSSRWPRSPLRALTPIRNTFRRARDSILPSYYSKTPVTTSPTRGQPNHWAGARRESVGPRMPLNISGPLNVDTRFAHLIKPDLAHHPARKEGKEGDMGEAF
ncbi:hypothetical protein EJ05DRAFT_303795 [Pseudovirgaria hyperparasitica]|uniref:DUF7598 domain-containing protein n=1 Tax=Pseudovirgaria hyperparasitica TaxID=470096 RepID=A0A6A6WES2_9PEZI|nr:uncharacterized protein EJ05DRAFT_303795 [Pseudovirgaria hyperparasitica]KAF2759611.1 hypothetical protein EJ05DRAFT_303795 [Pseudovirgaria hyperparasitica]